MKWPVSTANGQLSIKHLVNHPWDITIVIGDDGYPTRRPMELVPLPMESHPCEDAKVFTEHAWYRWRHPWQIALSNDKTRKMQMRIEDMQASIRVIWLMVRLHPEQFPTEKFKKSQTWRAGPFQISRTVLVHIS